MDMQTIVTTGEPTTLYFKKCDFCGETFPAKRMDAKTCGSKCRGKMYRWRKKLEKHHRDAISTVNEMSTYLRFEQSRPAAAKYLVNLDDLIKRTLVENGIKVVR